jgi:hypothetical protein
VHIWKYVFTLLALAAPAFSQETVVPEGFRGKWASSLAWCGKDHDGSLTITDRQVDFYASRGKVLSVKVLGPNEIDVELESRGEGEVWRNTRRFVLSVDGKSLTNVMSNHQLTRVKCG